MQPWGSQVNSHWSLCCLLGALTPVARLLRLLHTLQKLDWLVHPLRWWDQYLSISSPPSPAPFPSPSPRLLYSYPHMKVCSISGLLFPDECNTLLSLSPSLSLSLIIDWLGEIDDNTKLKSRRLASISHMVNVRYGIRLVSLQTKNTQLHYLSKDYFFYDGHTTSSFQSGDNPAEFVHVWDSI